MTDEPRYGERAAVPPTPITSAPSQRRGGWRPSPIFVGLVVVALASGWALWASVGDRGIVTFVFVAVSWVITLCLHEFAHAFVAYRNGDESVVHRGYLTLDPLKYTHLVLSLVLPLIFLLLGGIGLPGGAVFIDRRALRTRFAHSAVSAAGPLTNLVVAIVLCTAIFAARVGGASNNNLWAALAFLAFLQVTATVLNLLPVPGLDGYGIILQPEAVVRDDLDAGRLVRVMPAYAAPSHSMHLLFSARRSQTPKLRSFIDCVVDAFGRANQSES